MERISLPKAHRTHRRDLPIPHTTRSLNGAHRAKISRKWYRDLQFDRLPTLPQRAWATAGTTSLKIPTAGGVRQWATFSPVWSIWGIPSISRPVTGTSTASRLPKRIGKSLRTPTKPSLTRLHGKPRRSSAGRSGAGQTAVQYHLQRRIWRWPRGFSRRDRVSDESRITERTPRTVRLQDAWCGVFCVFGRVSCKFEFDGIFLYESGKHWFSLPDFKFVLPENPCKSGSFAKCLQFHLKNRLDNIHRT